MAVLYNTFSLVLLNSFFLVFTLQYIRTYSNHMGGFTYYKTDQVFQIYMNIATGFATYLLEHVIRVSDSFLPQKYF